MSALISRFSADMRAIFLHTPSESLTYAEAARELEQHICALRSAGLEEGSWVFLQTAQERGSLITLLALLEMECCVVLGNARWPELMTQQLKEKSCVQYSVSLLKDRPVMVARESGSAAIVRRPALGAALVVPTSGSSGEPKLALISLSALLASARGCNEVCPLSSPDCWELSLPLFHVGGLGILFRSLCAGSSIGISNHAEALGPQLGPLITHLSLVPTQLHRLMRDVDSVKRLRQHSAILLGGAPLGQHICQRAVALDLPIMPTYGLTEMASLTTLTKSIVVSNSYAVSVGSCAPGRELALGPDGEILVRGETLFSGYITQDGVAASLDQDGWFHTRDIGLIGPANELYVVGRADAQFISGGENIHPEMIENALTSISPIVAACVVPVHDEEFGARPYAFVVCDGAELNLDQIREQLRALIPRYAMPMEIRIASAELLSASGKINRRAAQALASMQR